MPATTWISDSEIAVWNDYLDNELKELLAAVEKITERRWAVSSLTYTPPKRWFCKQPAAITRYWVYAHISCVEWQVINFAPREESPTRTINNAVPRSTVMDYLMGIMVGCEAAARQILNAK